MTKRRRGSGSSGDLFRDIEAAVKNYSTVEQLLDHLPSSYPHYPRRKLRRFTKLIESVVMLCSRSNDAVVDSNEGGNMKRRKIDSKEEKLQLIDVTNNGSGGGCSSSASAISSGGSSSDEEASTSDDAIYGETKFDLMKPMMRENLGRKSKKLGEGRAVNKEAVELEVVENKGMKEVSLMNEESELGEKSYRKNLNENDRNHANVIDKLIFKDLWGISGAIEELKLKVLAPLNQKALKCQLGGKPAVGILLHGPPGCGKTKLARATANVPGVAFYEICATELVSGVSGESEENIRELFSKAYRTAPSIVFIDEIDAIASKRSNSERAMETRIVTQLLNSMAEPRVPVGDDVGSDCRPGDVVVIAATNRPDAVDPALRRPGRFDREIALGVPDEAARIEILSMLIRDFRVEGALDIPKLARSTSGFVGADLTDLANEASDLAMRRILQNIELSKEEKGKEWWRRSLSREEIENQSITVADFEEAAKKVQPSLLREGFSAIPNVKWDDVGGLHLLREEFDLYIVRRIKFPEDYEDFGVDLATGFLLYGPPGCGKTLIAKAVANEAGANFIHIKGPELMNKYVGESELAVRTIFSRARTCSPCILFFDEVDALTTKRGGQEGGGVVERVLNQLLIELDGSEQRRGVYVIGATNRPEVMDKALLRPGRFGKLMYVPLPSPDERGMILKALARKKPIDANVDLIALAKDTRCNTLSGADLSALMDRAAMAALKDKLSSTDRSSRVPQTIKDAHFTSALQEISPSVSEEQILRYELYSKNFKAGSSA